MRSEFSGIKKESLPNIGFFVSGVRARMSSSSLYTDEEVMRMCREEVLAAPSTMFLPMRELRQYVDYVFATLRRELEILQSYADDPDVTEIMVNGADNIFIENSEGIRRIPVSFDSPEALEEVIRRLAAKVGREMNDANPIVDARLSDGSRVNAVHRNIAIGGPVLTIRKFRSNHLTMEDLVEKGDITPEAAEFTERAVKAGYNIFVSGGTSSGKTTFLNILSRCIPSRERIVVIEDSAELDIKNSPNMVRLEVKNANAQGKGGVGMRDLIKTSLRMRPDRIIVGEVRGAEVVDMLAAMSTGHDGSLSTGHANSPEGMLGRLETMFLAAADYPVDAVRSQIAEAIDIFIHLRRAPSGRRFVTDICEVEGIRNGRVGLNPLYSYDVNKGLLPTGNSLIHTKKLEFAGEDGQRESL